MKRRIAVAVCLACAACSLALDVPTSLTITCASNAECPTSSICDVNLGKCVASETPSLFIDVPNQLDARYTREVPFSLRVISANADNTFDVQLEFRLQGEPDTWRPLSLGAASAAATGLRGSLSGTNYDFVWDALADAVANNGLSLARVDLEADGDVADPIVRASEVVIRAVARNAQGLVEGVPSESAPFAIGNVPPVATIIAALGDSGVINVVVGLTDSSQDVCGFQLQFRGPDGVWRSAALDYGTTEALGCLANEPLSASVGWRSDAPYFAADVEPPSTPQGIGVTTIPNPGEQRRIALRARAFDRAEAARPEQHWGLWSTPIVLNQVINQTSPILTAAAASASPVIGGSGPVHIDYTVADAQSDSVDAIIEFSQDAGATWFVCDEYAYALSEGTHALMTAPIDADGLGGVEHHFTWDPSRSNARIARSTLLRITLSDGSVSPATTHVFASASIGTPPHDAFAHQQFDVPLFRSDNVTQSSPATDVAIADFNNDGREDLFVAKPVPEPNAAVSIFANTGTVGAWTQLTRASTRVGSVAAGNFLGDATRQSVVGIDTIISQGAATLYTGNGDLTFGSEPSFNVGGIATKAFSADIDRDGDDDLLVLRVASGGYSLACFSNSGTAGSHFSSSPAATIPFFGYATVAIGDVDTDGFVDVVALTQSPQLTHVYLGDGAFGFSEVTSFAAETPSDDTTKLGIGDVNADGFPDIVHVYKETVFYHVGHGGPGSVSYTEIAVNNAPNGLDTCAFDDFNADGLLDMACVRRGSSADIQYVLAAVDDAGEPGARFASQTFANFGIFAADVNGDRVSELVALTRNGGLGRLAVLNVDGPSTLGGQSFSPGAPVLARNSSAGFPVIADFDGDGIADLAHVGDGMTVNRGTGAAGVGDSRFASDTEIVLGPTDNVDTVVDAKVVDLNGDGALDVAFLARRPFEDGGITGELHAGAILALPVSGVADAKFAPARTFLVAPVGNSFRDLLAVADFDADGRTDMAYAYFDDDAGEWKLGVAFDRGGGIFTQQDATYTLPGNPSSVDLGYVGSDPLPDIVVQLDFFTNALDIFDNAASPVSRPNPFSVTALGQSGNAAHLADIDWDGVTDLWVHRGDFVDVRRGLAGGGFGAAAEYDPNGRISAVSLFDATLDGINDLVVLGFPNGLLGAIGAGVVAQGVPTAGFDTNPTTFTGVQGGERALATRDVNCDAIVDVVSAFEEADARTWLRTRDFFTPQLSVSAPPYALPRTSTLATLGFSGVVPLHPWHIAAVAPCGERGRWEDDLRAFRASQGLGTRFAVLAPARWLGETTRYVKTPLAGATRWRKQSRFSPPLDLTGVPRGLVATLEVARARRAGVVPGKLKVYWQSAALLTAADVDLDAAHASADATLLLPQVPTSRGLSDVIQRRWLWQEVPVDGDGDLTTGTGKRYRYDATNGSVDILTDEGGLYAVVQDP